MSADSPLFNVNPAKAEDLRRRMAQLNLREEDLDEQFIRGSGPGGQKRNKTSVSVVLAHRPTGIQVRCGRERSQAVNRFIARRMLCELLEQKQLGQPTPQEQRIERVRRQKQRRVRRRRHAADT
jgi:protein subunit release factor B